MTIRTDDMRSIMESFVYAEEKGDVVHDIPTGKAFTRWGNVNEALEDVIDTDEDEDGEDTPEGESADEEDEGAGAADD